MSLIASSNALDTVFTPNQGAFVASNASPGMVLLQRRFEVGGQWFTCGVLEYNVSIDVPNPAAGAQYQWIAGRDVTLANAVVRADQ